MAIYGGLGYPDYILLRNDLVSYLVHTPHNKSSTCQYRYVYFTRGPGGAYGWDQYGIVAGAAVAHEEGKYHFCIL